MSDLKLNVRLEPVSKANWEEALKLDIHPEQKKFVPAPAESLATAYIKPWDEAVDPFVIYAGNILVGLYYLSYTPGSTDNYWIGGFIIDKRQQGKGYGKAAMKAIISKLKKDHPNCRMAKLTVVKDNAVARCLYRSLGFTDTGKTDRHNEITFELPVD